MATLTVYGVTDDGYVQSGNASYATAQAGSGIGTYTTELDRYVGQWLAGSYYLYETFIGFDTSYLGSGASISAAELSLRLFSAYTGTDFTVNVRPYDWGTLADADWRTPAQLTSLDLCASIAASSLSSSSYTALTESGGNLQSNINKTGTSKFVISSDNMETGTAPTGAEAFPMYGGYYGGPGYSPRLTITYTADATRLYIPSSGSPAITPDYDSGWEKTSQFVRLPTSKTKTNTGLASTTCSENVSTGDYDNGAIQLVYGPLAAQTITGRVRGQMRVSESSTSANMRFQRHMRVVAPDGSTVRGTLLGMATDSGTSSPSGEFSTTLTNRPILRAYGGVNLSSVDAEAGDYLVIELGVRSHQTSTTDYTATFRYGDPTATGDMPEDASTTTDLCPWIEFNSEIALLEPLTLGGASGLSDASVALWAPAVVLPGAVGGVATASSSLRTRPLLALSQAAGVALLPELVIQTNPGLLTLSQIDGIAAAALGLRSPHLFAMQAAGAASLGGLPLQAPAILTLGQAGGVAAAQLEVTLAAAILALSGAAGFADATAPLSSPALLSLAAAGESNLPGLALTASAILALAEVAGLSSASLAVTLAAPILQLGGSNGLSAASAMVGAPALLILVADGAAEALATLQAPALLALLSEGRGDTSSLLSTPITLVLAPSTGEATALIAGITVPYRRAVLGAGSVVTKALKSGVVVVRGDKLGGGSVVTHR